MAEFLSGFGHHVISLCELVGITEHYEHILSTAAVGALHTNPSVCIASVIGLWFGKFALHSYSTQSATNELQSFTDHFSKVTVNLNHHYHEATTAIVDFHKNGNRQKLFIAVSDLISAKGKENDVNFDPLYND